jgi:hypothetical protein
MKRAMDLWKEGEPILKATGHQPSRLLTDLTGDYYTLVLESTFADLAEFEKGHTSTAMTDSWRAWYQKFTELVITGRREIFTIVEQK